MPCFQHCPDALGEGIKRERLADGRDARREVLSQRTAGITRDEQHGQARPALVGGVGDLPPAQPAGQAHVGHKQVHAGAVGTRSAAGPSGALILLGFCGHPEAIFELEVFDG